MSTVYLGDPHNFGRRVLTDEPGKITKPRCIYWEYSLLSTTSELRKAIHQCFEKSDIESPFLVAPDLTFEIDRTHLSGKVTRLDLNPIDITQLSERDAQRAGGVVALCTWLGITDLHRDNIFYGVNKDGQFIFFPNDIECIFERICILSQTHLIPDSKTPSEFLEKSGLQLIRSQLTNKSASKTVPALVHGFIKTLTVLEQHSASIIKVLKKMDNAYIAPIRAIPRATRTYFAALSSIESVFTPPLIKTEIIQLKRGDIPYFFRFMTSEKIYYYISETGDYANSGWNYDKSYFDLTPPLTIGNDTAELLKNDESELRIRACSLQLTRFFSEIMVDGTYTSNSTRLTLDSKNVKITLPGKKPYYCNRKKKQTS
jgi:hypothetical protein